MWFHVRVSRIFEDDALKAHILDWPMFGTHELHKRLIDDRLKLADWWSRIDRCCCAIGKYRCALRNVVQQLRVFIIKVLIRPVELFESVGKTAVAKQLLFSKDIEKISNILTYSPQKTPLQLGCLSLLGIHLLSS